jgi:hypothetical protein
MPRGQPRGRRDYRPTPYPLPCKNEQVPSKLCTPVISKIFEYSDKPNNILCLSKPIFNYVYPHIVINDDRIQNILKHNPAKRRWYPLIHNRSMNHTNLTKPIFQKLCKTVIRTGSSDMISVLLENNPDHETWVIMMEVAIGYKKHQIVELLCIYGYNKHFTCKDNITGSILNAVLNHCDKSWCHLYKYNMMHPFTTFDILSMIHNGMLKTPLWVLKNGGIDPLNNTTGKRIYGYIWVTQHIVELILSKARMIHGWEIDCIEPILHYLFQHHLVRQSIVQDLVIRMRILKRICELASLDREEYPKCQLFVHLLRKFIETYPMTDLLTNDILDDSYSDHVVVELCMGMSIPFEEPVVKRLKELVSKRCNQYITDIPKIKAGMDMNE